MFALLRASVGLFSLVIHTYTHTHTSRVGREGGILEYVHIISFLLARGGGSTSLHDRHNIKHFVIQTLVPNAHYKGTQQASEVQIWLAVTESPGTPILIHIYTHASSPLLHSHLL